MTKSAPHPRAAWFLDKADFEHSSLGRVYGTERRQRLEKQCDFLPEVVTPDTMERHEAALRDVRVLFTTWGMPCITPAQLERLPALEICLYAAGSVRHFAPPLLERGVTVVSAWSANGLPVAEFCLAQILLSLKRVWASSLALHGPQAGPAQWRKDDLLLGTYHRTVGIVSLGVIGRRLVELLQPFDMRLLGYDPYVDEDTIGSMGAEACTLEELFRRSHVVSLHAPNLPQTKGLITGELLASMPRGATFLNTARGAVVDEPAMIEVLRQRPDLTAVLDVTDPEPPSLGSPLYTLPNVQLTPHVAGSAGTELHRMADFMIDEYEAWAAGRPLRYAVSLKQLETMA